MSDIPRMMLPLALLCMSAAVLSTSGSVVRDTKDEHVRDVFPGIGEYYFNGVAGTWSDAYMQCKLSGGHIAIINSDAEADALRQIMIKFKADSIHLGFHDQFVEGDYITLLDEPVDAGCKQSSQWAAGYPKGGVVLNCGGFTASGMMDTECDVRKKKFICELSDEQVTETPDDGYVMINGVGSYKLHRTEVTWPSAWQACKDEGSHLVVLGSDEEESALHERLRPAYGYWVGAHRVFGSEKFITVFDTPLEESGYNTWYYGAGPTGTSETHPYLLFEHNDFAAGFWLPPRAWNSSFICEK